MAVMSGLRGGRSNADKRRPWFGKDQHQRPWFANMDIVTGETVGRYEPTGNEKKDGGRTAPWSAPWYPPQQYITRTGNYRLTIDYETMIEDSDRANREYRDLMIATGIRLHGQAFDPEKPTVAVLHEIGAAPTATEIYVAMQQGNKFALGLSKTVDDRLKPFVPRSQAASAKWRGDEFAEVGSGKKVLVPDFEDLPDDEDENT